MQTTQPPILLLLQLQWIQLLTAFMQTLCRMGERKGAFILDIQNLTDANTQRTGLTKRGAA